MRWVNILKALTPAQFARKFKHPEMGELSLDQLLALYSWHSRHHLAHITELRKRKGW
ncbi:MAG TPA: DinB family protein [Terriglobales bacterium]|nr:DinB family protein [Terriglobales bacterium]